MNVIKETTGAELGGLIDSVDGLSNLGGTGIDVGSLASSAVMEGVDAGVDELGRRRENKAEAGHGEGQGGLGGGSAGSGGGLGIGDLKKFGAKMGGGRRGVLGLGLRA